MAFRLGNNAVQTASNQPTSAATDFNLSGTAVSGRQGFVAAVGDGNTATFRAFEVDGNGNPSGAWEIFEGLVTDAATDTLSRATILENSNGDTTALNWTTIGSAPRIELVAEESYLPRRTQSATLSNQTEYDILLRAGCAYKVYFAGVQVLTDATDLSIRVSTNGSTFDSGASDYAYHMAGATTTSLAVGDNAAAEIQFTNSLLGNASNAEKVNGYFEIIGASDSATYTSVVGQLVTESSASAPFNYNFGGRRLTAQVDTHARLKAVSGNISGVVSVWEFPLTP